MTPVPSPVEKRPHSFLRRMRGLWLPLLAVLLAGLGFLATRLAPGHEAFIETVYSRGLYRLWAMPISAVTSLLSFSLAEAVVLSSPLWLGIVIWRVIRRWRRRGAKAWVATARAAVAVLGIAAALFAAFSLGWALNYSRQPYAAIAGLPVAPRAPDELYKLCVTLTNQANDLRETLPEDQNGVFSADASAMRRGIADAYRLAAQDAPWLGGWYGGGIKPLLLSRGMSWAGISGIFAPVTFEANINADEPPLLAAASAAHEQAHLRGFAREDEANYIAVIVCRASPDAAIAYSGAMLALIHAGNALSSADADAYGEVCALRSPALQRDLAAYNAYWRAFEGPVREVQAQVNDAYLKSYHQDDGVRSYGRMVDLLLAEQRLNMLE